MPGIASARFLSRPAMAATSGRDRRGECEQGDRRRHTRQHLGGSVRRALSCSETQDARFSARVPGDAPASNRPGLLAGRERRQPSGHLVPRRVVAREARRTRSAGNGRSEGSRAPADTPSSPDATRMLDAQRAHGPWHVASHGDGGDLPRCGNRPRANSRHAARTPRSRRSWAAEREDGTALAELMQLQRPCLAAHTSSPFISCSRSWRSDRSPWSRASAPISIPPPPR